jgi:hypothetical protein
MSKYSPTLPFLFVGVAALATVFYQPLLSYVNKRISSSNQQSDDTIGQQSTSEKMLNFSIISDRELIFSVKPIPIDQQDFLYNTGDCDTAVLIKRNDDNNYEFIFADLNNNTEDTSRLIHKINKIIYRLYLFDILKYDQYILVIIECQNARSSLRLGQHNDTTANLTDKANNINFSREINTTLTRPKFVMCEYKSPCMGAQYDFKGESFRCSMDQSQILCFHNILGEHGTPGILEDHDFREEGNNRVAAAQNLNKVRQIERYHFIPINKKFYDKYSKDYRMTRIQQDISVVSASASSINLETEVFGLTKLSGLPEYSQKIKERIESGGNKIKTNKYKIKTNKIKTNKIKTNKYKK